MSELKSRLLLTQWAANLFVSLKHQLLLLTSLKQVEKYVSKMHQRIQLFCGNVGMWECGNVTRDAESGRDCFSAAHLFFVFFLLFLSCPWHILAIKLFAKRPYYSYYFKFTPNSCYDSVVTWDSNAGFFSLFFFPSGLIHMEIMTFDPDDPSKTAM